MDFKEKQLADMLKELMSRSKAKVILESRFLRTDFIVFVCWKLCNTPGYVVKPSDANHPEYARGIARYFGLLFGSFQSLSFSSSHISDVPVAF